MDSKRLWVFYTGLTGRLTGFEALTDPGDAATELDADQDKHNEIYNQISYGIQSVPFRHQVIHTPEQPVQRAAQSDQEAQAHITTHIFTSDPGERAQKQSRRRPEKRQQDKQLFDGRRLYDLMQIAHLRELISALSAGATGGFRPSRHGDNSGANQLSNSIGGEQVGYFITFIRASGHLHDKSLLAHVDDSSPKDLDDLHDLPPVFRLRVHLDQGQFPFDRRRFGIVDHLEHLYQFVQLLGDLFEHPMVASDHNGHAGDFRLIRHGDGKRFDIETATRKESGDARQDPR